MSESRLSNIATFSKCEARASKAMKILRDNFDRSYDWCVDCDGLVVKESQCCLNKDLNNVKDVKF